MRRMIRVHYIKEQPLVTISCCPEVREQTYTWVTAYVSLIMKTRALNMRASPLLSPWRWTCQAALFQHTPTLA